MFFSFLFQKFVEQNSLVIQTVLKTLNLGDGPQSQIFKAVTTITHAHAPETASFEGIWERQRGARGTVTFAAARTARNAPWLRSDEINNVLGITINSVALGFLKKIYPGK